MTTTAVDNIRRRVVWSLTLGDWDGEYNDAQQQYALYEAEMVPLLLKEVPPHVFRRVNFRLSRIYS